MKTFYSENEIVDRVLKGIYSSHCEEGEAQKKLKNVITQLEK